MKTEGWEKRLSLFLRDRHSAPFEWGVNDCMSFTAAAVREMTGVDFFTEFSDYHDEESAKIMLRKNGGPSGIITKCLGQPHRNYRMANRGDVVVVREPYEMGGIVDDTGQRVAVVTEHGLSRIPLSRALKIWKV